MQTDDRITEAGTEVDSDIQPIGLPSASIEANPMLRAGLYTKDQIYEAIEFGTDLAETAGFAEGHDSWIEKMMENFVNSLKPCT